MKIAYVVVWSLTGGSPIERKVLQQTTMWRQFGHEVEVFALSPEVPVTTMAGWSVIQRNRSKNLLVRYFQNGRVYRDLNHQLAEFVPDLIYLRSSFYHPVLGKILRAHASILELNGVTQNEANVGMDLSFARRLMNHYVRHTRKRMMRSVTGAVCVTREIADHDCKELPERCVAVIPNSIVLNPKMFERGKEHSSEQNRSPRLVMVCDGTSVKIDQKFHYHGLDKVIELALLTLDDLEIHLIGDPMNFPDEMPRNVVVHGALAADELLEWIRQCDVGLGTAALHRKDMHEACPLKVRDYLSCGLPVILPYRESAFEEGPLPAWVLSLPNTEANLTQNSAEIVSFCRAMMGRVLEYEEVAPYVGAQELERKRTDAMTRIKMTKNS